MVSGIILECEARKNSMKMHRNGNKYKSME
jgi:hypothetical protein